MLQIQFLMKNKRYSIKTVPLIDVFSHFFCKKTVKLVQTKNFVLRALRKPYPEIFVW